MTFLVYTDNLVLMDKFNNRLRLKFCEFEKEANKIKLQSNKEKRNTSS